MEVYNINPWKGLDSYNYSDNSIFYGRSKETEALVDIIINNRFTILYGPSGVGKSSLLNAGIRPILSENNYFVVDISMRLLDLESEVSISSQILSQIKECARENDVDITPLSKKEPIEDYEDSLWYFFHTNEFWSAKNELLIPLVIIDQFEDIFKDENRNDIPQSFFSNLDDLSNVVPPLSIRDKIKDIEDFRYNQSSDFRFVFSLREDYLPRLDDYVYSINIPGLRKSRYGITLMNSDQAREVILGPGEGIVSETVADKIISILSAQSSQNRFSHKIEPFLLSLFMYRIYIEMSNRQLPSISEDLINKIGADVVNDYYVESMKKVSSRAMKYLEDVLLTPKGHRDSISYDKLMESGKVTEGELKSLLSARIIKKNTVNNVDRFEFTHDILSQYAQKNKEQRKQDNKSKIVFGCCGAAFIIILAIIVGWIMSPLLTYFTIPLFIALFIFSVLHILNDKPANQKVKIIFLCLCGVIGGIIDLAQIIPGIGFILWGGSCIASLSLLLIYLNTSIKQIPFIPRIASVVLLWVVSFMILPFVCFGYNIFDGMNYARDKEFSQGVFNIKDASGKYGLRNRDSVILSPRFDGVLYEHGRVENSIIVKVNDKFGILDARFNLEEPVVYDNIDIIGGKAFYYVDGKEVAENGLKIVWDETVTEKQKGILRKIVGNMVLIKGGSFMMGTDVEKIKTFIQDFKPEDGEDHIHKVTLTDFYLNKYEVTLEEWKGLMGYDPRTRPKHCASLDTINNLLLPVYKVSYEDCFKFIDRLTQLTGLPFSLPTEAQWEYAAKGGDTNNDFIFSGSNLEFDVGWVGYNSQNVLHTVGELNPNSLGLYDMTGNVNEFCKDCYSSSFYTESEGQTDPCCLSGIINKSGKAIIQRGGSFDLDEAASYIITRRKIAYANTAYLHSGLRLAIQPPSNSLHAGVCPP